MQETDLRSALLAMRRTLAETRDSIHQQIQACDTMLTVLSAQPPTVAATLAAIQPVGSPIGTVEPPAAIPAAKPAWLDPQTREELILRANSRKRGAMEARVELAVAECGDTFSYHDVLARYEATHGEAGDWLAESVGSSLWKLARKRGYRIIKAGTGTLPTIYGK